MRWDRWVVPPAVSAAAFALLALAPPPRPPHAGTYRLEALGPPVRGRPWLLRAAALESPGNSLDETARLNPRLHPTRVSPDRGAWTLDVGASEAVVTLHVDDGLGLRALALPAASPVSVAPLAVLATDVRVLDGALLPEVPGAVVVATRAPWVELAPAVDEVTVTPARAEPDACGLASFIVRVDGLGAPVSLREPVGEAVRSRALRLPMAPGGVAVGDQGASLTVRSSSSARDVFVVLGDAEGPTWWGAVALTGSADDGVASVPVSPRVAWALAAPDPDFREGTSPMLRDDGPPCVATALGRRLAAGRLTPPALPPIRTLWDGAEGLREALAARAAKVRRWAAVGFALSIAVEVVLLAGAGLGVGPSALRQVEGRRRARLGTLAAGISLLLLAGAAMVLSGWIRAG